MNLHIPTPGRPPAWLISNVIVVVLVAAAVVFDRQVTHWAIPEIEVTDAQLDQVAADASREADELDRRINSLSTSVGSLNRKANSLEQDVDDLNALSEPRYWLIDDPESALARLSSAVALLSLISNFGGWQSTASPQGEACVDYFLSGAGSMTDCGWVRAD